MADKNCYWNVFNKREGVIKSFKVGSSSPAAKGRAQAWQKRNRPRGTRIVFFCIPPR